MLENIIFIGGINFIGKTRICQLICDEFNLQYLSASELLKFKEVNDASETANELIPILKNIVQQDKYYLLDWCFCMFNKKNEIVRLPNEIFKEISPTSLNLIIGNIDEIKNQLEEKDTIQYSYNLLERLQYNEMIYARILSEQFGLILNTGTQHDFSKIKSSLQNTL